MYYTTHSFESFDGCRLNVRESGEGPLLLLIHGGATDADFWHDAGEVFSQWFHVISYDRRCHVRSETRRQRRMLDAHMEDASALIRAFAGPEDEGKAYIICHSMGGFVGMRLCEKHPEQVRKILFHEPVFSFYRHLCQKSLHAMTHTLTFDEFRGRPATEEELANVAPDTEALKKYDLLWLLTYRTPYETLATMPVFFGVGEQSKGTAIYNETIRSAEKLNAPLLWFPGTHNCAFCLPHEFAYLCMGALL